MYVKMIDNASIKSPISLQDLPYDVLNIIFRYIPIDTQVAIVEAAESNTFLHLVLPKLISKVVNNENPLISKVVNNENPASASVDMKCIIVTAKNPKRVNIIMRKVLNEDIENVLYTERYLWDDFHSCCCRDEENFQLDRNMIIDGLKRTIIFERYYIMQ
ncbi:hypothetical protein O9G_006219 [Rozella allomycis CSF55]|uniref:F-box domain-containing protein n=1 Tax=Rozella allomycis (strain CSF55) TaxID=988480 RepID=A0A075B330_ROZAC|nr:hypothetical protein O9G_006219 [Rozella allomycis CSF55]|eukprot:EPZ36754.1 hypothetical protein O9G_006219 [Rozella allomycis CSF55]